MEPNCGSYRCIPVNITRENFMLRGGLLWLIGIPIPVIIILWILGYLS